MKALGLLLVFCGWMAFSAAAAPVSPPDGVLLFERGNWTATLHWVNGPFVEKESALQIEWQRQDHSSVAAPGPFSVALFMPGMGHGSYPPVISDPQIVQGHIVYDVSKLYFVMGGSWEIQVTLKLGSLTETEILPVTLPESTPD